MDFDLTMYIHHALPIHPTGYYIFDEPLRKAAAKAKARQLSEEANATQSGVLGKDTGTGGAAGGPNSDGHVKQ